MNFDTSIIFIVKKLSEAITARLRRIKEREKREELNEIYENPEHHHSDLFGESSGIVRVDRTDKQD